MSAIYLLTANTKAFREHGRMIVEKDSKKIISLPIGQIESVIISQKAHISTPLLFALVENEKEIFFVNDFGELLGKIEPKGMSIFKLRLQENTFNERQTEFIQYILFRKFSSEIALLKQYAKRKKDVSIYDLASRIKIYQNELNRINNVDEFRGIEGNAARIYFSAFPYILDNNIWKFNGRNRRPPRDPINALLSFGYTVLEKEIRIAIIGNHMDSRIGFFHSNNGRKDSLVYDIMELFRSKITDYFTLKLANLNVFSPADFEERDGGIYLGFEAKKTFIERYEDFLDSPLQNMNGLSPRDYIKRCIADFYKFAFETEEDIE